MLKTQNENLIHYYRRRRRRRRRRGSLSKEMYNEHKIMLISDAYPSAKPAMTSVTDETRNLKYNWK